MNILSINDQPDGSAIIELEMTKAEQDSIFEYGFLQMVKKGIEAHEDNFSTTIPE